MSSYLSRSSPQLKQQHRPLFPFTNQNPNNTPQMITAAAASQIVKNVFSSFLANPNLSQAISKLLLNKQSQQNVDESILDDGHNANYQQKPRSSSEEAVDLNFKKNPTFFPYASTTINHDQSVASTDCSVFDFSSEFLENICEWTCAVPFFDTLCVDDQGRLLANCWSEFFVTCLAQSSSVSLVGSELPYSNDEQQHKIELLDDSVGQLNNEMEQPANARLCKERQTSSSARSETSNGFQAFRVQV